MIDSASPPDLVLDLTTAGDHRFLLSISLIHAIVLETAKFKKLILKLTSAQCAFCKVRCHCIFYGPGIRYSGIFCVPCISSGYSDIFWHISVVDTVAYFGGNHGSRVWKSLKLEKVYFLLSSFHVTKRLFFLSWCKNNWSLYLSAKLLDGLIILVHQPSTSTPV